MAKKYIVTVNGTSYEVVVEDADPNATYTKAPEPAQAPAAEPEKPAEKAADLSEKLEVLTEGEKPQPVAPPPPAESVEEKKLDEVNAKLNDILGTRK